ncbi:hypothetical protein RclHR1_07730014 [Rhizophagus clarus]|uniref:Cytochrome P450 n=1 Tax=Rhizophagus clarus TaxID=94130 RepID=A0A2Z6S008_9GLOM|nr:hypothetical protein RclHR1_07730014 [Rhizophagus clarus]GES74599.1 cytochrome P450 [Rhizophagus clarus]
MISTIIFPFGNFDAFSILLVLIILYATRYYYHYFTRPNPLPGPFPLPILGNVHQKREFEYNDWLMTMHKKYGDIFEINMAGKRIIVLCRIDLIKNMNITSTKTKYPFRNIQLEGAVEYGLQGIASNNDLKSWKYKRQFYSQAMMTPSFNYQAIEWTNELWNEMETCWNNLGENYELDLIKWMYRFTNEIIFRISTGVKNDSVTSYYKKITLENNNITLNEKEIGKIEESEKFIKSIDTFLKGIIYFVIFNKFMRHYVPFIRGKVKNLLKNRDYLYDKIFDIIKKRRIEIENTPLDQPLRHDMLMSQITANTPRDISSVKHADVDLLRPMTDNEIFGSIIDSMAGGTATIANLFCFIVYYLGHYPEVKQRFRQELDSVLGTTSITYNDLDKLQYCDAIIKEVSRHCPVSFSIGRVNAEKDDVGGFSWPEGTSFSMFYYAMMRRKDYWTDPEKFDPNRFYKIEESDKYLLEKQYAKNAYTMFGDGIRICPGRKLAMIELKCLLASIYRKYDLELADTNAPLKYNSNVITVCKELNVRFKPRKF